MQASGIKHFVKPLAPSIAFLILPNAVLLFVTDAIVSSRALVNVDYLIIGLASPWLGAWISALLLALALVVDLVLTMQPIWFLDLPLLGLREIPALLSSQWWLAGLGFLILGLLTVGYYRAIRFCAPMTRRQVPGLVLLTLGLVFFDVWNGSSMMSSMDRDGGLRTRVNIATSSMANLGVGILGDIRAASAVWRAVPLPVGIAATANIREQVRSGTASDSAVLLVVVESWGILRNAEADSMIRQVFLDPSIRARYDAHWGTAPVYGSTIAGEMRELCGLNAQDWHPAKPFFPHCLPAQLKARGYGTIAFHGFLQRFFARSEWYPQVGFDSVMLGEQLRAAGVARRCGVAFRGICDDDIREQIRARLRDRSVGRRFVYWMTLASHFPLPGIGADDPDVTDCLHLFGSFKESTCAWFHATRRALRDVESLAADSSLTPTRIIVVGDHPPPFLSPTTRAMFEKDVPFVELRPRTAGPAPMGRVR